MPDDDRTLGELGYVERLGGASGEDSADGGVGRRYYGKHRGIVQNNVDPHRRGRLLVSVPDVLGPFTSSWAEPCLPFAGPQMGMYVVPAPGANVWVEFEKGDPDHPIWVGYAWGTTAEVPAGALPTAPGTPVVVTETATKNAVVLSDVPVPPMKSGGILLRAGASSYIAVEPAGITIVGPTVTVMGLTNVNNGALTVLQ